MATDALDRLRAAIAGLELDSARATFNPPATVQQLEKAEAQLGIQLPDAVRELYLCCDGMNYEFAHPEQVNRTLPLLFDGRANWASLELMVDQWQTDRDIAETWDPELDGEPMPGFFTQPTQFNVRWVPIGRGNSRGVVYLDLDPSPAGLYGQLFDFDYVMHRHNKRLAESFPAYLEQLAYCIERQLIVPDNGLWSDTKTGKCVVKLWDVTGPDWQPAMGRDS